jgi:hypothetical protein
MKKIVLFFTVTGFTIAASAQQNDFFDIQKYLQKKRKENNPIIKNPLLTKPSVPNTFTLFKLDNPTNQRKFSHTLSNGDKVYLLSQDNMACIIPDMKQFNMPNISAKHYTFNTSLLRKDAPGTIPNVASPGEIVTKK